MSDSANNPPNRLDGVHFIGWQSGFCINCGDQAEEGKLFCRFCERITDLKPSTKGVDRSSSIFTLLSPDVVANLAPGQIAFIKPSDIFFFEERFWILANVEFSTQKDQQNSVRIRRSEVGAIEAVYSEIDNQAIYMGAPQASMQIPSFLVFFTSHF